MANFKYCTLCKRNIEPTGRNFNALIVIGLIIVTLFGWSLGLLGLIVYVFYVKFDKVEECPICLSTQLEMARIPVAELSEKPIEPISNDVNITNRMSKLKELYEKGLINKEEYEKRKSELLDKI